MASYLLLFPFLPLLCIEWVWDEGRDVWDSVRFLYITIYEKVGDRTAK